MNELPDIVTSISKTLSIASHGVAGFLGSLTAAFLMKDSWSRRVALVGAGFVAAYYVAPTLAVKTHVDPEVAGYLTGLFSMAIAAKLLDTIHAIDGRKLGDAILRRLGRTK